MKREFLVGGGDEHLMLPPHSVESEMALLGALLLEPRSYDNIADLIGEDDFYTRDNRLIFSAIAAMIGRNHPLDVVTLAEYLQSHKQLDDVGGVQVLVDLVKNTPSAANIRHYAERVVDKSILRKVALEADSVVHRAYQQSGVTGRELLDDAQGKLMAIGQRVERNGSSMRTVQQVLADLSDHIDENYTKRMAGGDDLVIGLETGLRKLDEMTTGLQGGDLIIIGGRPSMGKTSLAINVAEHVAVKLTQPVMVFSFEMSSKQLTNRMLASQSGINSQRLWSGRIYDREWGPLTAGIGRLNGAALTIDEDATLTVTEIKARARRVHRDCGGLKLIVIDYLQLIATKGSGNRAEDLSEISRELKRLAKELNVPVIAISQLSRSVESRPDKRPILSDIRESGAIEQDADVVMFVYRDEYYNLDTQYKGTAEIIIAKQRNGPVDTVHVAFNANLTRFEDMDLPEYGGDYDGQ